ncbi:MAG: N-carbamoyl-L-amino acid hydrolase, partial [uncultured Acetobacteraceae bacterium]
DRRAKGRSGQGPGERRGGVRRPRDAALGRARAVLERAGRVDAPVPHPRAQGRRGAGRSVDARGRHGCGAGRRRQHGGPV